MKDCVEALAGFVVMLQFEAYSESAELAMSSINFESTYGVITIQDMNVVSVDANYCLLYTSPSPRDLDLSRMPSSA